MRRAGSIAVAVMSLLGVLMVLYLLIGGLAGMELQPAPTPDPVVSSSEEPVQSGAPSGQPRGAATVYLVVRILVILAIIVFVFGMLFSSSFRRDFLHRIIALAVTLVAMILFAVLLVQHLALEPPEAGGAVNEEAVVVVSDEPGGVPEWAVVALAVASAAGLVGVTTWLALRLHARMRRHPQRSQLLEEIAETARRASGRLRAGDPLAQVVLDCYSEMSRLVVQEEGVAYEDHLTAQEFASKLHAHGMRSEHARRLTRIFEVVRYGGRSSPDLADEATACLDAVRDHYAAAGAG